MIALGVVRYGFGNWDKVRMDTKLNLTYKINTSQANTTANSNQRAPLPNITHLNERIGQIIAALREARDNGTQIYLVDVPMSLLILLLSCVLFILFLFPSLTR
jgi:hypothetical protein